MSVESVIELVEGEAAEPETRFSLAGDPEILKRFGAAVREAGVAGDLRDGKLLYLIVTSRLLDKPVSVAVKGPPGGGKSFLVGKVLEFFPREAFYAISAMSERALLYDDEPLEHRMLVVFEAAGLAGGIGAYTIRSLLSEGRLDYVTVESSKGGLQPKHITRTGPTGLIVTTTEISLDAELETRLLSVTVNDSAEQTQAILMCLEQQPDPPDLSAWIELQESLAVEPVRRVEVPYAAALGRLVDPRAVRLRRDIPAFLQLIKAHALLHQATRARSTTGAIIATLGDFEAVRELVHDILAEGIATTVPALVRETVEAVRDLVEQDELGRTVTITQLAAALGLDKSSASRRAHRALELGYLRTEEPFLRGRAATLAPAEPLPDDLDVIPTRMKLEEELSQARARELGRALKGGTGNQAGSADEVGTRQRFVRGIRRLTRAAQ